MPDPDSFSQSSAAELDNARLVEATEKLMRLITQLESHIEQNPPQDYDGDADRARVIAFQVSIGKFFGSLGCRAIEREIFKLASKFHDLDRGIRHEIFKQKSAKGRNPDSYQLWLARAGVAAALQCFLNAKGTEKSAARRISNHKKKIEVLLRSGTKYTEDAAFNWLRLFKEGTVGSPENGGWQVYFEMIKTFEAKTDADWIRLGNSFLAAACNAAAHLI